MHFRICERRCSIVVEFIALSLLRGTYSLDKCVAALQATFSFDKRDFVFEREFRFRSVDDFAPLHETYTLGKSKTELKSRSQSRKRIYRPKTSTKRKRLYPSKNVPLKDENAFTEHKRKRVFRAEMSLSRHIFAFARKVFFAFQSYVFARGTRFRSVNAFSLGKRFFAFACVVFSRKKAFPPFRGTFSLGKRFRLL